jgi:hypothetical protein
MHQCPSPLTLWVGTPPRRVVLDTTYVIKLIVSDLWQVSGFLRVLWFPQVNSDLFTLNLDVSIKLTAHGEVYSIQHYVMKFDNNLPQIGGFLHQ